MHASARAPASRQLNLRQARAECAESNGTFMESEQQPVDFVHSGHAKVRLSSAPYSFTTKRIFFKRKA